MADNALKIPRKMAWLVLAAVLLLLGAAIGTEVLFRWAGGNNSVEPRIMAEYRPPMAPKAPSAALSLEDLLRVFSAAASAPAAQRFAADFRGQEPLMRLWKDFEGNRDLQAFVRGLRTSPEFSTLLRRFAPEPGFRKAAEQVAAYPPVTQSIRELLAVESPSRPQPSMLVLPPPPGDLRKAATDVPTHLSPVPVIGTAIEARGRDLPARAAPKPEAGGLGKPPGPQTMPPGPPTGPGFPRPEPSPPPGLRCCPRDSACIHLPTCAVSPPPGDKCCPKGGACIMIVPPPPPCP